MNKRRERHGQKRRCFFASFEPGIGSEQWGDRPVVIIQNDIGNLHSPTTIVAMITSKPKSNLPTHVQMQDNRIGLSDESIVLLEQIRTIDKVRLMQEFSRPLGDAVKKARCRLQLTQNEIAEIIDVDPRTILNIENYRGNPKMEVLYPLIRALNIDARSIFNSDILIESPSISQLRMIIESCTEQEAESIIPIITAVVSALRATERTVIE